MQKAKVVPKKEKTTAIKIEADSHTHDDDTMPLVEGQVTEIKPSGRVSKRVTPMTAFNLLRGLKTVIEIDEKAGELNEVVLRDVVIKVNLNANGRYYNLDETTLYQCVKVGGMESYIREVYGCGDFELVLRGFVTEVRKGIIASPKFQVLGQPTERMKMLMEQANRMRAGSLPSVKASYDPQDDVHRPRPHDEVAELKTQISRMAEDNRLTELTRRFDDSRKSDSDAINKRLDDMQTPKSNNVTELITAVIGVLPALLKREENPLMVELLKKRMSGSETLENARSMLEMMRELAPTVGGSGVTVGNEPNLIEQIISGVAPLLNRNKIIQESQPASVPTDNPFPQTVAHYENLQALARTEVAPVEFVKALVSAYAMAKQENAIASLFPELARNDDLSKSMKVFLERFDMTPNYVESVMDELNTYQGKLKNE